MAASPQPVLSNYIVLQKAKRPQRELKQFCPQRKCSKISLIAPLPPTTPTAPCRPQTTDMGKDKGRLSEEEEEHREGSSRGGGWSEGEDADAEYDFWPKNDCNDCY